MPNAVICDDDAVLRSVVADLAEGAGLTVVAETDHGGDVLTLVRRFGIDVVVLDLSLGHMSGNDVMAALREEGLSPQVVVFSAYAEDDPSLRSLGAGWIVDKPDLVRLAEALREAAATASALAQASEDGRASGAGPAGVGQERRFASRAAEEPFPVWRSPSGIEPSAEIPARLATCAPGDSVLAVLVEDPTSVRERAGDLVAADCVLEVARVLRATVRIQDIVLEDPACHGFLVLLRGGDSHASDAAWARTLRAMRERPTAARVRAGAALVDSDDGPPSARSRAVAAALTSLDEHLVRS
jgi:CheY-like chemotaxis protein